MANEENTRPEDWLAQFNTNFLGAVKVTRAILPYFRQRMSGKLVVIGSANGWRRGAGSGVYSASKFALEGRLRPPQILNQPATYPAHQLLSIIFRERLLNSASNLSSSSQENFERLF